MPTQEGGQDGRREHVPKNLPVVRSHYAHSLLLQSARPRLGSQLRALVRPAQEAGKDGRGEHLPEVLPVVRPHHLFPLLYCWFSVSPVASLDCRGLVVSSQEAHKYGRGKHLPKDLPIVRPHLLRLVSLCRRFSVSRATPALWWEP
jgi:hypothetical protein